MEANIEKRSSGTSSRWQHRIFRFRDRRLMYFNTESLDGSGNKNKGNKIKSKHNRRSHNNTNQFKKMSQINPGILCLHFHVLCESVRIFILFYFLQKKKK